ncbi:Wzz/FepE/Etk N-terminal domain-containing protein [Chromobacterium violaceum]|uniref:Wzz/FepE/Etk N-terminal domain-containing protein n=1 Tax=Chromobacterium violaceum TaxID=536 RepID=UPI0009B854B1|nr:Wzz/FepE/Etk N-terminal domain-containing protein [Chromobacterium violaceum]
MIAFLVWVDNGECILERQSAPDELSLFDIILVAKEQWRLLLAVPLLLAVLAAGISLAMPNQYTAKAMLNIPAPVGATGGVNIVQSTGLLEQAVEKYQLQRYYQAVDKRDALLTFSSLVKASVGKDGLLEISVTDRNADQAAALGNYLMDLTRQHILDGNLTEQSKRYFVLRARLDSELAQVGQLSRNAAQLLPDQEAALGGEGMQVIRGFATLEAQLAFQNAQAAGNAGSVSNLQSSVMQLRASLELANPKARQLSNEQLTALRDLYFHRALAAELQRQVSLAKSLTDQDVQIVLKASAPLEKSGPKRTLIVVLAGFAGLLLAIAIIVCKRQWCELRDRLSRSKAA